MSSEETTTTETEETAKGARTPSRRQLLKQSLLGLAALVAMDSVFVEPRTLRVETVTIPMPGLSAAFDGYRIALLTDFHYPRWIRPDLIRRAIALGNYFQPDLMAFTGDFFDLPHAPQVPDITGFYDQAKAKDGVVGVLGNHDHVLNADLVRSALAAKTPIRLIENQSLLVERGGQALAVGGVGDLWHGVVDPERAFANVAPEVPRILLSHNPDLAEEMQPNVRVDLQLSGHTHGGQIRIPFGPALLVPSRYGNKFSQGLVQGKRHRVYTSRGLCTVRWVRFWCPPEVTHITLRAAPAAHA